MLSKSHLFGRICHERKWMQNMLTRRNRMYFGLYREKRIYHVIRWFLKFPEYEKQRDRECNAPTFRLSWANILRTSLQSKDSKELATTNTFVFQRCLCLCLGVSYSHAFCVQSLYIYNCMRNKNIRPFLWYTWIQAQRNRMRMFPIHLYAITYTNTHWRT